MMPVKNNTTPAVFRLSEKCWLLEAAGSFSEQINSRIHVCAQTIRHHLPGQLAQVVPAYHSLLIEFHDDAIERRISSHGIDPVQKLLTDTWNSTEKVAENKNALVELPVYYGRESDTDLETVSDKLNLDIETLIRLHTQTVYRVYMLGFLPGFCYLGKLPESLFLSRKSTPVPVKKGAVAIAGHQTGIYPCDSPGGWHILGYTPCSLFNPGNSEQPTLLQPGQRVKFYAINYDEYLQMKT